MRITSQKVDTTVQRMTNIIQSNGDSLDNKIEKSSELENKTVSKVELPINGNSKNASTEISKEKVQQAVESINEFIAPLQTNSKFVYHEGLDEYYVKVIDSVTEEVIKEIPPERLLNAFYEMQKLAGMIVDEKV